MEASIYARANGYLKRWLVDLGSQVEAGQLLAEIDIPESAPGPKGHPALFGQPLGQGK